MRIHPVILIAQLEPAKIKNFYNQSRSNYLSLVEIEAAELNNNNNSKKKHTADNTYDVTGLIYSL